LTTLTALTTSTASTQDKIVIDVTPQLKSNYIFVHLPISTSSSMIDDIHLLIAAATTPTTVPFIHSDYIIKFNPSITQIEDNLYLMKYRIFSRFTNKWEPTDDGSYSYDPIFAMSLTEIKNKINNIDITDFWNFLKDIRNSCIEKITKASNATDSDLDHDDISEIYESNTKMITCFITYFALLLDWYTQFDSVRKSNDPMLYIYITCTFQRCNILKIPKD
jgi:hypothetical protein